MSALAAAVLLAAFAGGPAALSLPADCLACHGDPSLTSSRGRSIVLDPAVFQDSVHGRAGIVCTDCHAALRGVEDFPHDPVLPAASCLPCHTKAGTVAKAVFGDAAPSGEPIHSLTVHLFGRPAGLVKAFYGFAIPIILAVFGLFVAADLIGRKSRRPSDETAPSPHIDEDETFERMSVPERLQHLALILAFAALAVSGLWRLIDGRRGPGAWAAVHRTAAVVLIAVLAWHVLWRFATRAGRGYGQAMRPRKEDAGIAVRTLAAGLGRRGNPPPSGRFSFIEKSEYWGVAWGMAVMTASGALLWTVGWSLGWIPLPWLRAARLVHRLEAVLAVLSVLLWHMYNAHLRRGIFPMDRAWLDGRIKGGDLRRRHRLVYEEIAEGRRRAAGAEAGRPR